MTEAATMPKSVEYAVFVDKSGNRMIFPGVYQTEDHPLDTWTAMSFKLALNLTQEPDLLKLQLREDGTFDLEHVSCDAIHRGFAHGGANVWLIGGPKFEEVKAIKEASDVG